MRKQILIQTDCLKLQNSYLRNEFRLFEEYCKIYSVFTFFFKQFFCLGMDDEEEEVVPLPNVNSAILKKVIQWATYHKDDPPPPEDDENKEKRTDDISSWDADFLKVDQGTLFELILVSLSFLKCVLVICSYYSKSFN